MLPANERKGSAERPLQRAEANAISLVGGRPHFHETESDGRGEARVRPQNRRWLSDDEQEYVAK